MFSDNDRISIRQVKVLLILDLFGVSSLTLPKLAANYGKEDAWLVVILSTLLAIIYAVVVTKLACSFPNQTFTQYTEKITNRFFAVVISVFLLIKFILASALELRVFGELIKQTMLRKTPIEIIMISMLLTAAYLARKGYESRGRLGEMVIVIALIPILMIFLFATKEVNIRNLMPMFVSKPSDVMKGIYNLSLNFGGVELMLLATAYLNKPKKAMNATIKSIIIVGILNLIITVITIGTYGVGSTTKYIWPVLSMMSIVEIPILFIERQDALMMSFWIITVFSLITAYIFFASLLLRQIFKLKEQNYLVLPLLPFIYIIALIPDNIVQTYDYIKKMTFYLGPISLIILPLILLSIAKIRKLGGGNGEKN